MANTLAYYYKATIIAVKSFIVQAPDFHNQSTNFEVPLKFLLKWLNTFFNLFSNDSLDANKGRH